MRRPVQNQPALLGQRTDVTEPRSDTGAGDEETTESYINSFYEEVKHAGSRLFIETFDNAAHLKIKQTSICGRVLQRFYHSRLQHL